MLNSLAIATINVDKVWDAEKIKDLTEEANHGKMCGVCVRGVGFVPPPHVANIRDLGAGYKGACASSLTGTPQVNSSHFLPYLQSLHHHNSPTVLPSIHSHYTHTYYHK